MEHDAQTIIRLRRELAEAQVAFSDIRDQLLACQSDLAIETERTQAMSDAWTRTGLRNDQLSAEVRRLTDELDAARKCYQREVDVRLAAERSVESLQDEETRLYEEIGRLHRLIGQLYADNN